MKWHSDELLHGGDYNPDQWLKTPSVLDQDQSLMKQASINTITVGIFSWSKLEPSDGEFDFEWLDQVFDRAEAAGQNVILATPSGAKPAWLAQRYPEVLRTNEYDQKMHFGERHNHCFTSPIYRQYVQRIDRKLAERYGQRKNLLMWHISNEFGGECHCELCQSAFRQWLKDKYHTLEALNAAWYTSFWNHSFDNWEEIHSPTPLGDTTLSGLNADWRRFVTEQTIDFYEAECAAVRTASKNVPITTNFMADTADLEPFHGLDYAEFAQHVDVVSWDCYPTWENPAMSTATLGAKIGMINDYFRSLKQQNFLIMESTPSLVNWHAFNRAKRPGQHRLASLQFIAHGADSVLYFQWRQSRGATEKFHGAVVGQDGSADNRIFKEVAQVGNDLQSLHSLAGINRPRAKVAIIYDKQSHWNLDATQAFAQSTKKYWQTLQAHYDYFWQNDIPVDVISPDADLKPYSLVIDLMHYSLASDYVARLKAYVAGGGTLVGGYLSGLTDPVDLAYLGEFILGDVYGVQRHEIDTLYPTMTNGIVWGDTTYPVRDYAEVLEPTSAQTLATFATDFYAGSAAVTRNTIENGDAYYIGGRSDASFLADFYTQITSRLKLSQQQITIVQPEVSVQTRVDSDGPVAFVMNFSKESKQVTFKQSGRDLLTKKVIASGEQTLPPYGVMVFKE